MVSSKDKKIVHVSEKKKLFQEKNKKFNFFTCEVLL